MVISGEMDVDVERTLYTIHPYEGVLVFPNQMHSVKNSHSKHILFIFFFRYNKGVLHQIHSHDTKNQQIQLE